MQRQTHPLPHHTHTRGRNTIIFFHAIPHKPNNHLHVINPNAINRPIHNPPPKRNRRGGACVPARTSAQRRFHTKNTHIVCGELNDGCALVGRHGRAHRLRPYPSPSYFSTQSHPNQITIYAQSTKRIQPSLPISIKPHGVSLPHRGYTFDSAGLASATQPTLGNDASENTTPLGVVLFLIAHHYHTRRMNVLPHEN